MKLSHLLAVAFFVLIALSLTIYIVFRVTYAGELELQLVTVVFRHGDRMPHTDAGEGYANNTNAEKNYFPIGQSGLTNEGKLREYNLGQFLRERYNNFLGSTYLPEVIEARSTNYDRTKVSLQLVLAGLYPPDKYQMWNSSINWQPIPTYYEPETEDILLTSMQCSRYLRERDKIMQVAEVKEKLKTFENLMKNFTILSGRPINNTFDIHKVYYTIDMEHKMNLTIPNWAYDYLDNKEVMRAIMFDYEIMIYNNFMRKLSGGPLIRKISEDIISIRNGTFTNGRKINLYSGHESSLVVLLSALGLYKLHIPKFSSAVMVELYRFQEEYYVQVVYYLGIPPETHILEIPGCLKLCPLDKFVKLMEPVTPSKDENICD